MMPLDGAARSGMPVGEGIYDTANFEVCEDMADGKKKVAAAGKSVKFRIVRILCEAEVKLETTVAARIV